MPIRPSRPCLYLSVLASLWTSAATASEGPSGEVALGVSPGSALTVQIDSEQLTQRLCTVSDPDVDEEILTGKCKATTLNLPPRTFAPCGPFDVSMATFDRPIIRPGTELVLRPSADDPGHGVFAGEFDIKAHVRFTHRETGRVVDFELRFGFSLEGPWVLADPGEPLTAANLILLAERDAQGQIQAHEQCVELDGEDPEEDCRICLHPYLWKASVSLTEAVP